LPIRKCKLFEQTSQKLILRGASKLNVKRFNKLTCSCLARGIIKTNMFGFGNVMRRYFFSSATKKLFPFPFWQLAVKGLRGKSALITFSSLLLPPPPSYLFLKINPHVFF